MKKTLISVLSSALVAWLLGLWLGAATGWGVFALSLLCMVLVSGVQHHKIQQWSADLDAAPPHTVGPWDDVLAPIYRRLKQNRIDLHQQSRQIKGMIMAAEALPDGVVTLAKDMTIQWCNQTASLHMGLNNRTDQGQSIFNILRAPEFAHYAHQGQWQNALILPLFQLGRTKTLQLQLSPYGLGQFLLVSRDITQVEKLETTRKDFVANVSHELRTPLTVLLGFLETLTSLPADTLSTSQRQHYEQLMLEQAQHMQNTVSDLLTLSALESSPLIHHSWVPMRPLIEQALQRVQALSNGRHQFEQQLDPDLAVEGVATELSSAINNLLANAIHYTPAQGTISVNWLLNPNGSATFSVQDTGIGIAPHEIPRLTERFYRTDKGRSRASGGTGLGLAITRHVVSRHHAQLQIKSRLGQGSTFSITFPAERIHSATLNT